MAELSERLHDVFERIELNTVAESVRMTPVFKREVIERHGSDNLLMHLHAGRELEPGQLETSPSLRQAPPTHWPPDGPK